MAFDLCKIQLDSSERGLNVIQFQFWIDFWFILFPSVLNRLTLPFNSYSSIRNNSTTYKFFMLDNFLTRIL